MTIGLVLSSTPMYSETFFYTKIKGLKASGFEIILFAQNNDTNFSLCEVKLAPSINKGNELVQFFQVLYIVFGLLLKVPKRVFKFILLERQTNRQWIQIIKNLYNNSHILTYDLDWVHFGFATIALQSEHVAQAIEAKMAVSFRGYDMNVYPKKHLNCYKTVFKNVDKVHAISNYMLQQGYALGLSKHKPFKIITPAIDISVFSTENKIIESSLNFLTVARLHNIKGLYDTIKAMYLLKEIGLKFRYVIVGDGPEYNGLNRLIKKLELTNHVYLEGKKNHKIIVDYMQRAQVYIQYSESEGFCNAVLEAQAMGLLCVVSDGGALPENVIHEQTGWVVPKKNPELLAQAIQKIILLPDSVKEEISSSAQARVKTEFNLHKQQIAFKSFYIN